MPGVHLVSVFTCVFFLFSRKTNCTNEPPLKLRLLRRIGHSLSRSRRLPPARGVFFLRVFLGASPGGGTVLGGEERSRRRRKHGGGGGPRVFLERKPGNRETRSSGEVTLSTCHSRCIHRPGYMVYRGPREK